MSDRVVYSTDPARQPCPKCGGWPCKCPREAKRRPSGEQALRVHIDRKARKGKVVTIVEGFVGPTAALEDLASTLKKKCGAGGSVKEGAIVIQGDKAEAVKSALAALGFSVR